MAVGNRLFNEGVWPQRQVKQRRGEWKGVTNRNKCGHLGQVREAWRSDDGARNGRQGTDGVSGGENGSGKMLSLEGVKDLYSDTRVNAGFEDSEVSV